MSEDKAIRITEIIQQNKNDPHFMDWLARQMDTDPAMIMDVVQQNLSTPSFVDWLADILEVTTKDSQ